MAFNKIPLSKISQKITFAMILIVLLSSIIMGAVVSVYSGRVFKDNSHMQVITIEKQILKNINTQLDEAMKQFMFLEIDDEFKEIAMRKTDLSMPAQFTAINHLFEKHRMQQPNLIDSIFFYRDDGQLFSPYTYESVNDNFDRSFYEKAKNRPMEPVWSFPGIEVSASGAVLSDEHISIIKEVNDVKNTYGVLVFNIKTEIFREILNAVSIEPKDFKIMMTDAENNILLSAGNFETDVFDWQNRDLSVASEEFTNNGALFVCSPALWGDFRLISMFSGDMITKQSVNTTNYIIYCVVLGVMVFLMITYLISRIITKPLTEFTKAIHPAIDGNYDIHFEYSHNDEIGTLVNTYNAMVAHTQKLIEQIKAEKELKSKAELKSLQQQINAHFLYNTLDVLYWLSKNKEGEKAAEITASLSEMLRISVSNGKDIIQIKDEKRHLEKYLSIQKFRFDFDYCVEIDEGILGYSVPKLILQPIAENAIIHGFEDIDYTGRIEIKGYEKDGRIVFEITDDGCGFEPEKLEETVDSKSKSTKYALKNLDTRFRLMYGEGEYMTFVTAPGKGAKVIISLPIM